MDSAKWGGRITKKALIFYSITACLTGAIVLFGALQLLPIITIARLGILFPFLAVIALADWRSRIVPNKILLILLYIRAGLVIPDLALGSLTFDQLFGFSRAEPIDLADRLGGVFVHTLGDIIAGLLMAGVFYLCSRFTKGGLGMGDVKLVFVIASFVSLDITITGVFLGFLFALMEGLWLLFVKKKSKQDTIALVPCLLLGMAIAFAMFILAGG